MYTVAATCRKEKTAESFRVEIVDNWHTQWPAVLAWIASRGELAALMIGAEGWLSARQVLLVAFAGTQVKGHVCFRLVPTAAASSKPIMEAHLDAFGVQPGTQSARHAAALRSAALKRAKALRCRTIVGFSA